MQYYTQYGLALRGLTRHHDVGKVIFSFVYIHRHYLNAHISTIDPLDFDRKCDGALPLEDMIQPNPAVRKLFQDIDRSKARVWALTNAYRPVGGTFIIPLCIVQPYFKACATGIAYP